MKTKTVKKEDALQSVLTSFKCKNCSGEQLVTKPRTKHVKGGGVVVLKSKIKCDHCKRESIVTRYPNGFVRSYLLQIKEG